MSLNPIRVPFAVAPLLAALLLTAPSAFAQDAPPAEAPPEPAGQPIDEIVAIVEEDVILKSELDLAVEGIKDRIRAQGASMPSEDLLRRQVLERLIMRKLQVQNALRTGIRVSDTDIDQALVGLAQQNQISLAEMRGVIESEGEDFSEFRQSVGEELITERLRQRVVNGMSQISETEVDILLASQDFAGGEYNVSHILVSVPEGATPAQLEEAAEEVREIYQQLEGGMDFASAAISYSDSQDALEGGVVGWRDLNSMPTAFSDAIRQLQVGEYSQPLRSPAGFHIVRLNDFRDIQNVTMQEYKARHIMVTPDEVTTPRQAMDQINDIHRRLMEGEDFAELAREFSDDDSTANIGGDMGWFPPDAYGDRVQQTLATLEEDEISQPFQTQSGWHIMQKTGERETDITEESVRNMARQTIHQRKADQEIQQFLQQMRDEAYVEVRLES